MNLSRAISRLKNKENLAPHDIEEVFDEIFTSKASDKDIRAFLVALYEKGESYGEILGAVRYLRSVGESIRCHTQDLVDCCGTGGDKKNTFNISTATAFVLAGAGCHVAKHGNVAISSRSGSADILRALGVNIQAPQEVMRACIDEIGIGFLFAPNYYPLLKRVGPVRKSIPHRTIFNLLGPLLNPAHANRQLIGVFDGKYTHTIAKVLKELGSKSVVVVHAQNGMDEFSLTSNNTVSQLKDGSITDFVFDPRQSGYAYCRDEDLLGGTAEENAARLKKCLKGHSEPLDHTVHINAAWGLIAAGRAEGFMDALIQAQESISSGGAYEKLQALIEKTAS